MNNYRVQITITESDNPNFSSGVKTASPVNGGLFITVDVTGKNSIEILRNAYNLFANHAGTDTIPTLGNHDLHIFKTKP